MKKHRLYKIFTTAILFVLIGLTVTSCRKMNEWEVDESHSRLFRPSEVLASVDGVTAKLTFKGKPGVNSYIVELSKDSLKFTEIVKSYNAIVIKDGSGFSFAIPDLLEPNTQYSARIKGTDSTGGKQESEWAMVAFKTKTEQIMYPVDIADLTTTTAKLKWKIPNQVSHIMIGSTRYDITTEEAALGEKVISNLTPATAYTATLYFNTSIRGTNGFTTISSLPTGPNVINVGPADDLATMIQSAANGTIFVLLQGSKYNSDNPVIIPSGISLTIYGEDGPNKPIVAFNGITLSAVTGTLKFENIDFTGFANGDPNQAKRNYIFNQGATNTTAEINFQNCSIRNFVNSPMRVQSANVITIDKFTVNNCLVYDIGDNNSNGTYAFIHATGAANSRINNISIKNSTFYKIGYALIVHGTTPSQSVAIENCTFNNTTGNGRIFIDYNSQTIGSFSFNNNIFGKTLSPAVTAKGIRYAGTNLIANNCFTTSDAAITGNAFTATGYSGLSTQLFADPDNGNFKIIDNAFTGKETAGDPRWR
ncbi:DUF5123 domain-containing protein [Pedobacter sp. ASV1-7]|uniref:DUF5123 domain-containing protein n=1 Tax=Pedobacter sp. ASV1-7 TaxID=3145237 RepID=UPI0032E8AFAB